MRRRRRPPRDGRPGSYNYRDIMNLYVFDPPHGYLKHVKTWLLGFIPTNDIIWDGWKLMELLAERVDPTDIRVYRSSRDNKITEIYFYKPLPSVEQVEQWCIDPKEKIKLDRCIKAGIV